MRGNSVKKLCIALAFMILAGSVGLPDLPGMNSRTGDIPDLVLNVDPDDGLVTIEGDTVPLASKPVVKKKTTTKKYKKKVKLPKKATKTKKSTKRSTKKLSNTKVSGSKKVVTKTTIQTTEKTQLKKKSNIKTISTTVKTTVVTTTSKLSAADAKAAAAASASSAKASAASVSAASAPSAASAAANTASAAATSYSTGAAAVSAAAAPAAKAAQKAAASAAPGEISLRSSAPKAHANVIRAFEILNFKATYDPSSSLAGRFAAAEQSITIKSYSVDTLYHEIGHFVAFVSGNKDRSPEWNGIYNSERSKYVNTGRNTSYVTGSAIEYFAESYRDLVVKPNELQKERPQTYEYLCNAVAVITEARAQQIKEAYAVIWH